MQTCQRRFKIVVLGGCLRGMCFIAPISVRRTFDRLPAENSCISTFDKRLTKCKKSVHEGVEPQRRRIGGIPTWGIAAFVRGEHNTPSCARAGGDLDRWGDGRMD